MIGDRFNWAVFKLVLLVAFVDWLKDPRIIESICALVLVGLLASGVGLDLISFGLIAFLVLVLVLVLVLDVAAGVVGSDLDP